MMTLLQLTDTDAVRATLGVEERELPDSVFINGQYEVELELRLLGWLTTAQKDAIMGASSTDAERRKQQLLVTWAKYQTAVIATTHLVLGIAQEVTDGQDAYKRSPSDWKALAASLQARADEMRNTLLLLLDSGTVTTFSIVGSAAPGYDPVTGTGT